MATTSRRWPIFRWLWPRPSPASSARLPWPHPPTPKSPVPSAAGSGSWPTAGFDSHAIAQTLASHWLSQRTGRLRLVLDETVLSDRLCCMCLSIVHHKHAIPLAWRCYQPGQLPASQLALTTAILQQVHDVLGLQACPLLMVDRGLAW